MDIVTTVEAKDMIAFVDIPLTNLASVSDCPACHIVNWVILSFNIVVHFCYLSRCISDFFDYWLILTFLVIFVRLFLV